MLLLDWQRTETSSAGEKASRKLPLFHVVMLHKLKWGGVIVFTNNCLFLSESCHKTAPAVFAFPTTGVIKNEILKNPEVLMLQYQGTFDQRQDGWHSSEYED